MPFIWCKATRRKYRNNCLKKLKELKLILKILVVSQMSLSSLLKKEVTSGQPLRIVGTINAYCALMAEKIGHKALYLSGGGVAASSYGVPDLAITTLDNVLEDVRRISGVSKLPLLVDADTGWGGAFNIAKTVTEMERAGASAIHIEDQVSQKRCGHRPNKEIVSTDEMTDRIKAAVDARKNADFVIMARTDALAVEGINSALERSQACVEAGADMIFPEALTELSQYSIFSKSINAPILANITEFGATPLFKTTELFQAGVQLVLYPLSAFRAMSKAAEVAYSTLLKADNQMNLLPEMQTRQELYNYLDYHKFEKKLDELFKSNSKNNEVGGE